MTFLQQLLAELEKKNSWGKNEIKMLILDLMAKFYGDLK